MPFCKDPLCSGDFAWTNWFNVDKPEDDGDLELLSIFGLGCGQQSNLDQVETVDGESSDKTGQVVHLNTTCFGFMCLNREQRNGEKCRDYQIRQCCPKESIDTHTTNNHDHDSVTQLVTTERYVVLIYSVTLANSFHLT